MPKNNLIYECSHCGAQYQKWAGRCLECGQWGSIPQEPLGTAAPAKAGIQDAKTVKARAAKTVALGDVKSSDTPRRATGLSELDRVLGGGIVPGSLILLGGEPGIGKSTLALQLTSLFASTKPPGGGGGSLYISGEESAEQIKLRAERITPDSGKILISSETDVDTITATIVAEKPLIAIVDSIQTISSADIPGEPGNPTQVRAAATKLLNVAKTFNIAIVLIGHVTKEGTVAGPRTLEHLVDTVLYLEGERHHSYRLLRTVKNRFGPTDEVGIFEMRESGLHEIKNAAGLFIADRGEPVPGSILTCLMEGTRPMLIEVQALVNKTVFGYPVRKASGFDLNRLHVLTAVLEKHAGLQLGQYDIYVNVVGGVKANEPSADLAVCLAIASSYKDKALGNDLVVFGEVGLGGEVRNVGQSDKRIREAASLGMKRVITAASASSKSEGEIKITKVKNIVELITHA